ncbi:hypothetical protein H4219_001033 [Mycoemilia scoparia]|uniref:Uncharacterized protein n=1 Tax=Mycoemilia scoparia TaxID=417184 RepID=A0A9W8A158_9FUNG|nr:hypothetical protein H4219_001033 [Mycoemilia scoparia]
MLKIGNFDPHLVMSTSDNIISGNGPLFKVTQLTAKASDQAAFEWVKGAETLASINGVEPKAALNYVDVSILSTWSSWRSVDETNRPCTWQGFKDYLLNYRGSISTKVQRTIKLIELSTHVSIDEFNAEFMQLAKSIGIKDNAVLVGLYATRMPPVLSLGPAVEITRCMDVVAARINAHSNSRGGLPMEVDALGFGFENEQKGAKSKRRPNDYLLQLKTKLERRGVSKTEFDERFRANTCLLCGKPDHHMRECGKSSGKD